VQPLEVPFLMGDIPRRSNVLDQSMAVSMGLFDIIYMPLADFVVSGVTLQ
jgi:hypothetical protein